MKGSERLRHFVGFWPTDKGAWFPGETVRFRDRNLFADLSGEPWFTLLLYGISGHMPTAAQRQMVETIWAVSASFPDPRLWNNRVAALAGSARSTGSLALAAATGVTEATVYGSGPVYRCCRFLVDLRTALENGGSLEQLVLERLERDRVLPGFGRPVTSRDERVGPLLGEARKLGFGEGYFVRLVKEIETLLARRRYRLYPNIASYCAALFSDLGYSPHHSYLLAVLAFSAGMFPCYVDALEKPEGCLFPLDCESILYSGQGKRRLVDDNKKIVGPAVADAGGAPGP